MVAVFANLKLFSLPLTLLLILDLLLLLIFLLAAVLLSFSFTTLTAACCTLLGMRSAIGLLFGLFSQVSSSTTKGPHP